MKEFIFTSESVSEGHPDKICDQISDAIVDYYLAHSAIPENARVACETMVTTNKVFIAGEVRGDGELSSINKNKIEQIARDVVKSIGYEQNTFHWNSLDVDINLHSQSPDISMGVDAVGKNEEGAGDQGHGSAWRPAQIGEGASESQRNSLVSTPAQPFEVDLTLSCKQ